MLVHVVPFCLVPLFHGLFFSIIVSLTYHERITDDDDDVDLYYLLSFLLFLYTFYPYYMFVTTVGQY